MTNASVRGGQAFFRVAPILNIIFEALTQLYPPRSESRANPACARSIIEPAGGLGRKSAVYGLNDASRSFSAADFCTWVLAQLQKHATRRAKGPIIFKPVSMCFISLSFLTPLNRFPCHRLRKFISSCCQTNYGFPATKLIRTKCCTFEQSSRLAV